MSGPHALCDRCRSSLDHPVSGISDDHGLATGRCTSCCEMDACRCCAAKEANDCQSEQADCCSDEGCESDEPGCCDAREEE